MEDAHSGQITGEAGIASTEVSCDEQEHTQSSEETHPKCDDDDVPSPSNEIEIDSRISTEPSFDGSKYFFHYKKLINILYVRISDMQTNTSEQNKTAQNVSIGKKIFYLRIARFSPCFGLQNE